MDWIYDIKQPIQVNKMWIIELHDYIIESKSGLNPVWREFYKLGGKL